MVDCAVPMAECTRAKAQGSFLKKKCENQTVAGVAPGLPNEGARRRKHPV